METMSNCLGVVSASATQPVGADEMSEAMRALLAVGVCTLAVWTFVRLLRPGKFRLSDTPARPNALHALHVFTVYLIYIIAQSLTALAVAAIQGIKLVSDKVPPMTVLLPAMSVGLLVLIVGVLGAASMTFRGGLQRGLGLSGRRWLSDIGRGVVGFLAVLPLCVATMKLMKYLIQEGILPIEPKEHPALEFVGQASPAWVVVVFAVIAVLAPIAEELFFRGLLQSLLRKYLGGPWAAVLAASAIFAAAHHTQPQAIPALFILAIALGYNYERTGRLLGPIIIHAIFNAVMLWNALDVLG